MPTFLIFIIGLPCSGKSTVASAIAQRYGFVHLASENIRADLLDKTTEAEDCDFTPEQHVRVYSEIERRTIKHLNNGKSVIIDGVYRNDSQRAPIMQIIADLRSSVKSLLIWLTCEEQETIARLVKRKEQGTTAPAGINSYK